MRQLSLNFTALSDIRWVDFHLLSWLGRLSKANSKSSRNNELDSPKKTMRLAMRLENDDIFVFLLSFEFWACMAYTFKLFYIIMKASHTYFKEWKLKLSHNHMTPVLRSWQKKISAPPGANKCNPSSITRACSEHSCFLPVTFTDFTFVTCGCKHLS